MQRRLGPALALTGFLTFATIGPPNVFGEESGDGLSGSVEFLYRNVDVRGSERKYDEDFDALASGGRIANFAADWLNGDEAGVDYARINLQGLGGDPYERNDFRIGKQGSWEFKIKRWRQNYIYDLFELVDDEDGNRFDTERQQTQVGLTIRPSKGVRLVFEFQETDRTGDSLFVKDVSRELFRLEAPLNQRVRRYIAGADFRIGKANVIFRQQARDYRNDFVNLAEGNAGLEVDGPTQLNAYDWQQLDTGDTPLTTLAVSAPIGDRFDVSFELFGTVFGEEDFDSEVDVEQLGLDFAGNEFGGECAATGVPCGSDASCDAATPGDVCVPLLGRSRSTLEGDSLVASLEFGVAITPDLSLNLAYETLDRDLDGRLDRDLDGDGSFEDLDGDGTPGSVTRFEQQVETMTALVDYQASRAVGLRVGYRLIDRELDRSGFGGPRDTDFESDGDETVILGVNCRPTDWLRIDADYEDGQIDRGFTAPSFFEREQLRARLTITPEDGMRLGLSFRDNQNNNVSPNFRLEGNNALTTVIDNRHEFDGRSWSADWWHKPSAAVQYTLRYALQDFDSNTGVLFDTAGFGAAAPGTSVFDSENTQVQGRVDFRISQRWRGFARAWSVESDGENVVFDATDPAAVSLLNLEPIDQQMSDVEAGADYTLPSGVWLGVSLRSFDYDDQNDRLDYDGEIVSLRAGLRF